MSYQDVANVGPSGILPAATAAVRLVGYVLQVASGVRTAVDFGSGGTVARVIETTGAGPVNSLNRMDLGKKGDPQHGPKGSRDTDW